MNEMDHFLRVIQMMILFSVLYLDPTKTGCVAGISLTMHRDGEREEWVATSAAVMDNNEAHYRDNPHTDYANHE
jgi:hypothetical protein